MSDLDVDQKPEEAGEFWFLRLCPGKDTDQNNATGKDISDTSTGADLPSGRAHLCQ